MNCSLCDGSFGRGEPKTVVGGEQVHMHCDVDAPMGVPCDDLDCQWWRVSHAGQCVK